MDTQVASLVDTAPGVLDTLNELATALQNNPDIIQDLQDAIANKVSKAGDTMTGTLNMGTNVISNLGNATADTDALNRQTADGRYYLNSVKLNAIQAPVDNVDLNTNKIINLADP